MGFINSGNFTLSAQWWTGDPLKGGTFIMNAEDALAPYTATVSPAMTPEPSTILLLLGGLGGLAHRLKKRRAY